MNNIIISSLILITAILLILIAIVLWCCLYVGSEYDRIIHILANEYIEEKKV